MNVKDIEKLNIVKLYEYNQTLSWLAENSNSLYVRIRAAKILRYVEKRLLAELDQEGESIRLAA